MIILCNNCAFSLENRPNVCVECEVCIRNPTNASIKFKPTKYKDTIVEKPIDMYISKELMEIIRQEIRKMYEEGIRAGKQPQQDLYPFDWNLDKWKYSS